MFIWPETKGNNTLENLCEHYHTKEESSQIFSVGQRKCLKLANLYPLLINDLRNVWNA